LAFGADQHEQFDEAAAGVGEGVRGVGVELGDLAVGGAARWFGALRSSRVYFRN